jgi:hypothetical protein
MLAWFEEDREVASIQYTPSQGARSAHEALEFGVHLRGTACDIEGFDLGMVGEQ